VVFHVRLCFFFVLGCSGNVALTVFKMLYVRHLVLCHCICRLFSIYTTFICDSLHVIWNEIKTRCVSADMVVCEYECLANIVRKIFSFWENWGKYSVFSPNFPMIFVSVLCFIVLIVNQFLTRNAFF